MLTAQLSVTQGEAAEMLGVSIRTSNGYANGEAIPEPVARLLRLLVMIGEPPHILPRLATCQSV
jgi:hypothetical protein